jgi:MFS family permease
MYFPAIPTIAKDLSVSSELINLTVTSYLIFQGLSPSIWGAVADVHGRRAIYILTFVIYLGLHWAGRGQEFLSIAYLEMLAKQWKC